MNIVLTVAAFVSLVIGYLAALVLTRTRVESAISATRIDGESKVAALEARCQHLAETVIGLEGRLQEANRLLNSEREARQTATNSLAGMEAAHAAQEKTLSVQKDSLQAQETELTKLRAEVLARSTEVSSLQAQLKGHEETSGARLEALQEAQQRLGKAFQALSAEALKANNESFLQLARTQMEGNRTETLKDFEARQQAISSLLLPVQTTLGSVQEQVQNLAKERAIAENTLGSHISALVQGQATLQNETGKLANALRKPEVRGQWGEVQLRNVVEYAGMKEHVDFEIQSGLEVGDQKRRPDMLVNLPGRKCLPVDAKAPLQAYLEAVESEGEVREERLKAVAAQVRAKVKDLGDKRYYDGLASSPDFVVLFLPLEALFSTALERDPHLMEFALQQNVILASPTTLVALLKAAAFGWAQERIQANAEEIQKLGTELVDRMMNMAEHIDNLRKGLVACTGAFNDFAGSFEQRVLVTGQKLQSLGIRPTPRKKQRSLGLQSPQPIHTDLSGLPKLGIQGTPPVVDAQLILAEDEDLAGETAMSLSSHPIDE